MKHNEMKVEFLSKSENESFARVVVSAFAAQLDPTIEEISDIKTAISEAVTNSIIHGYEEDESKLVKLEGYIDDNKLTVVVIDEGVGIDDLEKAREPLYTSRPDLERSGMGFTVMETFMDKVEILSEKGKGTKVTMSKTFNSLR
ncbi:anti-sigma F factor [Clostridium ihumii]|uniref:anti-sigma F factor n=1 Tax=Clostridium ihumii TaxID=1470356 RepID=UPI00058EAAD0|nr:anti-sigma F factor [Clostridium ihumii]